MTKAGRTTETNDDDDDDERSMDGEQEVFFVFLSLLGIYSWWRQNCGVSHTDSESRADVRWWRAILQKQTIDLVDRHGNLKFVIF